MTRAEPLQQRLRRLAHLVEQGDVPPRYADRLAGEVDRALRVVERDRALRDLADLLPGSSRWEIAGRLAEALERFQSVAWPRIRVGARPARTELERRLAAVLEIGHQVPCRRLIWEALPRNGAVLEPPTIERARSMATG